MKNLQWPLGATQIIRSIHKNVCVLICTVVWLLNPGSGKPMIIQLNVQVTMCVRVCVCVWNGNQRECVYVCVNNYIMVGCLFTHCAANDELINKDFNYSPKQGALSHTHSNTTVADRRWHPVAPWFSAGTEMFIVPTIFCLNLSNRHKNMMYAYACHTELNTYARTQTKAQGNAAGESSGVIRF